MPGMFDRPLTYHEACDHAALLRAVANPARLQILAALAAAGGAEVSQTGVCQAVPHLAQPTVASHLRCLIEAGFVVRRRDRLHVWYLLSGDALMGLARSLRPPAGRAAV
jgi:ArsR family transcriptional regulator